jgi:hypothetical protein
MRFHLYYDGQLTSAGSNARLNQKHAIRKAVYPQLLELFRRNQNLPKLPEDDRRDWANWKEWEWPHFREFRQWDEERAVFPRGAQNLSP